MTALRHSLRLACALVALPLALVACSSPERERGRVQRWIEEAPSDELLVSKLKSLDCVVGSRFEGGSLPEGILLADASPMPSTRGHGVTLRGGATAPRLRFARRFLPGEIDAARLTIAGVRRGNVRLRWFVDGQKITAGSMELTKAQGGGTLHDEFYFDLAQHLPASGPVEIEIEPTSAAGELVTLAELCVGRARLDGERLGVASKVAWKVTLGDEARDVLVQPASGKIAKSFALAGAARLAAGFGRLAGSSAGVRLTVEVEGADEPAGILFDRQLGPGELAEGWVDFEVDLSGLAGDGSERRFTLSASPEPAGDPGFVGVWSAPRVVATRGRSGRPNIVLISLDTLRADHLSLYGYARATSPHLDQWVRERRAAVFRQVVAPSGWTLPSHFSLFTGLDAFRHPANYNTVAIDSSAFSFLAERLLAAGYRTQAFTGGGFVHPVYGLAKGFESFAYWASKERRSEELDSNLRLAGKWLDRLAAQRRPPGDSGEPFLLFLHTYEIHTPYTARQPYFGNFSGLPADLIVDVEPDGDLLQKGFLGTGHPVSRRFPGAPGERLPEALAQLPADLYDSAIGYVDEQLAPFLRRLSEPPFAGDTIVVIFSDHGESLGEGGLAGHAQLTLNNLLVPLIVALPGNDTPREIPSQVRLIDLFPTLLELAGLEVPSGIDGLSLRGLLDGGSEPEGRSALAYAASTNHGLSLLAPTGLKLDWRNSLWKPIAGSLLWFRRDGFEETALGEAPSSTEAGRMVRQIQQAYARGANGLRFELRNLSARAVRAAITSDLVDPSTVKSPRVDGVQLEWRDIGFMEAGLAADSTLALHFERSQGREIEVKVDVRTEGCDSVATTTVVASVEQLRQPMRRHLDLPACAGEAGRPSGSPGLELEVAWIGPLPSSEGMRSDAALREDLKALGYIH
jgi:arylsulfatase A-like enzyme